MNLLPAYVIKNLISATKALQQFVPKEKAQVLRSSDEHIRDAQELLDALNGNYEFYLREKKTEK